MEVHYSASLTMMCVSDADGNVFFSSLLLGVSSHFHDKNAFWRRASDNKTSTDEVTLEENCLFYDTGSRQQKERKKEGGVKLESRATVNTNTRFGSFKKNPATLNRLNCVKFHLLLTPLTSLRLFINTPSHVPHGTSERLSKK